MLLKIEHLCKSFGDVTPIKDISCEIDKGDVIAVIGPSGTGKSTFINCINRLIEPTSGKIWFDGEEIGPKTDLPKLRMRIGMVFQAFHLFSHLTVLENVMMAPMDLKKMSREDAYHKAMELLDMVGLTSKADRYPFELSGGQQQRVAICRSLAMDPEILLFDEPTSALDPTMVSEVETVIKRLVETGLTMIIVTHEMRFAANVSNRVFYLDEGGIYEDGTPEQVFEHPQREKTRWFINRMKVFSKELESSDLDYLGFMSELSAFAHSQMMSAKVFNRVQLLFEELYYGIFLKKLADKKVVFQLAYNDVDDAAEMLFEFDSDDGVTIEPDDAEKISADIIRNTIVPGSYRCKIENGRTHVSLLVARGGDGR